jgi:hypothetical protein
LSKYDELMEGLVDEGINKVDNVISFLKALERFQSEARRRDGNKKQAESRGLCFRIRSEGR